MYERYAHTGICRGHDGQEDITENKKEQPPDSFKALYRCRTSSRVIITADLRDPDQPHGGVLFQLDLSAYAYTACGHETFQRRVLNETGTDGETLARESAFPRPGLG